MKFKKLPSQKYLKECLRYEPQTGRLFWKKRPLAHFAGNKRIQKTINARCAGKEAFIYENPCGHRFGSISGSTYFAHRIIWKLMTGKDPMQEIDHANRRKNDNTWNNLRIANNSENQINRCRSWGAVGIPGIRRSQNGRRWEARIHKDRQYYHLGTFITKEAALAARAVKARELYGEFAP